MVCPECTEPVAPMPGSGWAIAWYSCRTCSTFWYARLSVGPAATATNNRLGSPQVPERPMLAAAATPAEPESAGTWSLEELEAETDVLRRESERLPKGDPHALIVHMRKLRTLADAINHRLDALPSPQPQLPF